MRVAGVMYSLFRGRTVPYRRIVLFPHRSRGRYTSLPTQLIDRQMGTREREMQWDREQIRNVRTTEHSPSTRRKRMYLAGS